jgi:hypothetical protein
LRPTHETSLPLESGTTHSLIFGLYDGIAGSRFADLTHPPRKRTIRQVSRRKLRNRVRGEAEMVASPQITPQTGIFQAEQQRSIGPPDKEFVIMPCSRSGHKHQPAVFGMGQVILSPRHAKMCDQPDARKRAAEHKSSKRKPSRVASEDLGSLTVKPIANAQKHLFMGRHVPSSRMSLQAVTAMGSAGFLGKPQCSLRCSFADACLRLNFSPGAPLCA